MKEFDYIILGGGLSGLTLAYELNKQGCLENKTLCILEKRKEYSRDKSWSYWDFENNKFPNCVIGSWDTFSITLNQKTINITCPQSPYRTIDSKKFYDFVTDQLRSNDNIVTVMDCTIQTIEGHAIHTNKGNYVGKVIYDSLIDLSHQTPTMYQHFFGCEVETDNDCFNENIVDLMNFDCSQDGGLHFFYTLPFSKNKALIETTWYSKIIKKKSEYQNEIDHYLREKNIKGKITYTEYGAIPLNLKKNNKKSNSSKDYIKIGSAGRLTRASTGYTFQAIQSFSEQLAGNLKLDRNLTVPNIRHKKYDFLDEIFLSVMEHEYKSMPGIFFNLFKSNDSVATISFLSDRSNWIQDLKVILSMPKLIFIKNLILHIYKKIIK
ncbi:lycopene cyclase family protein [Pelagibacteraceae bacterium]|jgi:lycopene beta-cyclase|nr:lycopene cyclase family protein [Pelagibacteraceae bacterium]MDC1538471.1 lycopene cyclase family protein [Pelagibacteraceae bacterium]